MANNTLSVVFFGSFQHYSTIVLESLVEHSAIKVLAIVTTPPMPAGRKKVLTKTHTHEWGESHHLPVFNPEVLTPKVGAAFTSGVEIPKPDFFVVAGYGKLLPPEWLNYPKHGSLNLHFSLLPKFRGANPAEWAILLGETKTGVTLIEMAEEFDTGKILAQSSIPINPTETRITLYEKLYTLGAEELPNWLISYGRSVLHPYPQSKTSPTPDARRFNRSQGFIPWEIVTAAMQGKPYDPSGFPTHIKTAWNFLFSSYPVIQLSDYLNFLERTARALTGYPSVWTYIPTTKGQQRLKILAAHCSLSPARLILDTVQLEGHSPAHFNQIKNQIVTGTTPAP